MDRAGITWTSPGILYGGDYNPEQWDEDVWLEDVRLMRRAGVNLVSLGVFAWAALEPRPGSFDFAWLDRIADLLVDNGVRFALGTATVSPPPWLARAHPETLPVTAEGGRLWPGSREHFCPSSRAYREAASRLVERLADRYRDHPGLAMWHVNNEYACHVTACFCPESVEAFRGWLRERYGSIDELNRVWGTSFWSQRYSEWDEVDPPLPTPELPNPTQAIDWRRFSSEAFLDCFRMERDILRRLTPGIPVTTNFMCFFEPLDYWRWAAQEEVVTNDSYPDPADPEAAIEGAMASDLSRSLGGGRPWILLEQSPSNVNWREVNVPKEPGLMRLWSHQAIGRGADGVMFFQWRASRFGAEKLHAAMVPHAGTDTRVWREVEALGNELGSLSPLVGTRPEARVAIAFDWESWWALELPGKLSVEVRLMDAVRAFYGPLFRANVLVDFVHPEADLGRYRLVVAPSLYMVSDRGADNISAFVHGGGTLVMSFFSGIVDENDHVRLGGYAAPFREALGMWVEELRARVPGDVRSIRDGSGDPFETSLWTDAIRLEGAEAIAVYAEGRDRGATAVTRHVFGEGVAYYLGTAPSEAYLAGLLARACSEAGVDPTLRAPAGVEALRRAGPDGSFLFLLNHGPEPATVGLDRPGVETLTGRKVGTDAGVELEPLGVAIVAEEREA